MADSLEEAQPVLQEVPEESEETISDENPEQNANDEPAEEEVVVTIGEDSPPPEEEAYAQTRPFIELRKSHRELLKKNRELEERLKTTQAVQETQIVVGKKPSLEDDGIEWDTDKYEEELSKWYDRKRLADDQAAKIKEQHANEEKAWKEKLTFYEEAKSKLRVPDYEDAELALQQQLSATQQGIILQGSENPAHLVYALGKNQAKAKELAAIKDPVEYAFAVAKLETQLKITKRNAPLPERSVLKGSAPLSGSDSTLNRLYSEAEKTGDYSKVVAYKKAKIKGGT